ncbi:MULTISPECIES: hypothetical protein [Acinetobacter]|uniref:hypothetical protein n=1 Tax=Acinetobacter TaxID=469 RepID=UPI001250C117|nr:MULTISPECIES: hypothetical protein [Acinetobacter]MBJ9947784.1 hypothetical protein [Acinetobacter bereziniae]BCX74788.1 hypothetical protein TOL5_29880 [Acinetobacter sp. Tol 5]
MSKVLIKLTAAVVIEGVIRRAGEEVEINEQLAKELLYRGRGTLEETDSNEVDLSKLTMPQLIEFAKSEYDVDLDKSLNKKQMIEAIQSAAEE